MTIKISVLLILFLGMIIQIHADFISGYLAKLTDSSDDIFYNTADAGANLPRPESKTTAYINPKKEGGVDYSEYRYVATSQGFGKDIRKSVLTNDGKYGYISEIAPSYNNDYTGSSRSELRLSYGLEYGKKYRLKLKTAILENGNPDNTNWQIIQQFVEPNTNSPFFSTQLVKMNGINRFRFVGKRQTGTGTGETAIYTNQTLQYVDAYSGWNELTYEFTYGSGIINITHNNGTTSNTYTSTGLILGFPNNAAASKIGIYRGNGIQDTTTMWYRDITLQDITN